MNTQQRPFHGKADVSAMIALARAFPADNLHSTDLPYRFSSWALDDPDNVALWQDDSGALQAWAVLQAPFWTIDVACRPAAEAALLGPILDWAQQRARQALGSAAGRPSWYVHVFAGHAQRVRALEAAGFASQANVGEDSWSKVLMRRSAAPLPGTDGPDGFTIRPLEGDSEIDAYVALQQAVFGSRNMTAAWRARTLRQPDYIPALDLVAVAPDGRLAGFCIAWLQQRDSDECVGQIEPLGVGAEFRGLGLGRALLAEALRRLQQRSVRQVDVETDNYRDAALALYEALGFRVVHDVLVYRKDFS